MQRRRKKDTRTGEREEGYGGGEKVKKSVKSSKKRARERKYRKSRGKLQERREGIQKKMEK